MKIDNIENQIFNVGKEADMYRTDYESFKSHYEQSQNYVQCLEIQIV